MDEKIERERKRNSLLRENAGKVSMCWRVSVVCPGEDVIGKR